VPPHEVRMASATTKADRFTCTKASVDSDQIKDQPDSSLITSQLCGLIEGGNALD
jgi:hypothetical protein